MNAIELVLGGARSGKSRYGEQQTGRAEQLGLSPVVYVATAFAGDREMSDRIKRHRDERPAHWFTREESVNLAQCLADIQSSHPDAVILVDCLTLWLTNCLLADNSECWPEQKEQLLQQLGNMRQRVILVSNEVGQGVVPMGELSRRFVDEAGWLHQDIAALANDVTLVVAGLPMALKRNGQMQSGAACPPLHLLSD